MKAKKLTVIAALVMFSLSGTANAMLPIMMLLMGPMMGMGGMMQSKDGHGDSAQVAAPAEAHDHASGTMGTPQGGDTTSEWHRHETLPGISDPAGVAKELRLMDDRHPPAVPGTIPP